MKPTDAAEYTDPRYICCPAMELSPVMAAKRRTVITHSHEQAKNAEDVVHYDWNMVQVIHLRFTFRQTTLILDYHLCRNRS